MCVATFEATNEQKAARCRTFGSHSHCVWRDFVCAVWSSPLRFLTYGTLFLTSLADHEAAESPYTAVSVGVAGGVVFRFIENLAAEFLVFPSIARYFVGKINANCALCWTG